MTKEQLEEIFYIQKEIQDLEDRINKKEENSEVGDTVQNGYKKRTVIYGIDIQKAYQIRKLDEKLRNFKIKLIEKKQEIEDYIEKIPFSEIRQIFRLRYIDGKPWYRIALDMDYNNEDTPRKKHDRYLKRN